MQPFLYKKLRKNPNIYAMISEHFDGEIIARLISYFSYNSLRGSSRRGGAKALLLAMRYFRAGSDIVLTPDGPKGPRYSVADGVIAIARKNRAKIVTFNYKPDRYWQLNSWDRFVIPKPFSKITFYSSEAFDISNFTDEEAKDYIKKRLMENAI